MRGASHIPYCIYGLLGSRLVLRVNDGQFRALGRKRFGDRATKPAGCAGHNHSFSG
jgi:hypothetical protein